MPLCAGVTVSVPCATPGGDVGGRGLGPGHDGADDEGHPRDGPDGPDAPEDPDGPDPGTEEGHPDVEPLAEPAVELDGHGLAGPTGPDGEPVPDP